MQALLERHAFSNSASYPCSLPHPAPARQDCKAKTPAPGKLKEFGAYLAGEGAAREDVKQLAKEVHQFASSFAMPGGDW